MVDIWITKIVPPSIIALAGPFSLLLGYLVERYYTGRVTIFLNAIALITYFYNFQTLPEWLIWYINFATVAGAIAFVAYTFRVSLPKEFYYIGSLFSSMITGLILLMGALGYFS